MRCHLLQYTISRKQVYCYDNGCNLKMKVIPIACAAFLLLAIFRFPIGYYTFLRIVITIGAIIILSEEFKKELNIWLVLFGMKVILFNPVFPIYLYKKSLWVPIDIAAALLFICYTLKNKKNVQ